MTDDRRRTQSQSTGHPGSGRAPGPDDRDRVLLQRMAKGDEAALAALYDQWGERVHAVAYWILRDADEAEDVVEETFWQAWRTATGFDGQRAAGSTWLMMIARSRALDRLRAQRRKAGLTTALSTSYTGLDETQSLASVASEAAADRQHRALLSSALSALPPEQRETIELAFFGGLSHAEIAAKISQPLGTVKTRIRLAMQKLRQSLALLREEGE